MSQTVENVHHSTPKNLQNVLMRIQTLMTSKIPKFNQFFFFTDLFLVKFHKDSISSFYVKLLTDKQISCMQTDRQTDRQTSDKT